MEIADVFSFSLGSYIVRANYSVSGMEPASRLVVVGVSGWGSSMHC